MFGLKIEIESGKQQASIIPVYDGWKAESLVPLPHKELIGVDDLIICHSSSNTGNNVFHYEGRELNMPFVVIFNDAQSREDATSLAKLFIEKSKD